MVVVTFNKVMAAYEARIRGLGLSRADEARWGASTLCVRACPLEAALGAVRAALFWRGVKNGNVDVEPVPAFVLGGGGDKSTEFSEQKSRSNA